MAIVHDIAEGRMQEFGLFMVLSFIIFILEGSGDLFFLIYYLNCPVIVNTYQRGVWSGGNNRQMLQS